MKKTFTILIAAIAAILMMTQPMKVMGQTRDKITNYTNIVSGTSYYIGATTGTTDYYLSVDGSNLGTEIAGTAVPSMANATPFIFSGSNTSWTIQFDDNNGYYMSLPKKNGKVNVVESAATFTASNVSSLIQFSNNGYSIQKNSSGTQFGAYSSSQTKVWLIEVPSGYTVAYDCNGGTTGCPEDATNIASGTSITLADAPSRLFFTFAGWNDGSQTYEAGDSYTVTDNVTMTAQWTLNEGELVTLTESNLGLTGSYSSGASVTIGDITYVHTDLMKSNGKIQAKASSGTIKNNTAYSGNILGVIITHDGTANSTTIWGSDNGDDWTSIETGSGSITADFSELQDKYQYFKITRGSGAAYWTKIEVIYVPSTDPSITADDVNIECDDTNGNIEYTINNTPNPAGTLTAAIAQSPASTIEGLTIGTINGLTVPFTCFANNTTTARTATVTLTYTYGDNQTTTQDVVITQAAHPTPSITASDVNIDGDATNGSIGYTISNPVSGGVLTASTVATWLTPGEVTSTTVPFTCTANQGAARSATVVLTYTYNTNQTVTKNVTVTQAKAPFTTITALFAAATNSSTSVDITFGGWVVSGVSTNGKNVFVTDNEGHGFNIYDGSNNPNMGFAVGDVLTGTVTCNLKKNNGYAQLLNLNSSTSGISIGTGGTLTVADITMAELSGVNTGALVHYENLTGQVTTSNNNTYYYLKLDDNNKLQVYGSLYPFGSINNGSTYTITGIYQQYSSTKEVLPRSANDVVLKAQMTAPSFNAFTYVVGEIPTAQTAAIAGTDFSGNLTVTVAEGQYVVSNDGSTYGTSATFTKANDNSISNQTLYVKLNSDLSEGTYNGRLSFTANYLDAFDVDLVGSVATNPTYNVTLTQPAGDIATIAANPAYAQSGATITLSYSDVDDCYEFSSWSVMYEDSEMHEITPDANNQFEMPAAEVYVSAVFTQKKFTVNYSVNGTVYDELVDEYIDCGDAAYMWDEDEMKAEGVTIPSGFEFAGWSTSANSTETVASFEPTDNSTLYAVLVPTGVSSDYVKVTEDLDDWSGEYLIVYENGLVAFDGSRDNSTSNKIDAENNTIDITDYIDNGVIESNNTTNAAIFTISAMTGGYSIQSASGYYIGSDSHSNELDVNANTAYANSLSIDDVGNAVIIGFYESNSSYTALRYNSSSNQNRFRYYKEAGQQAIQLYKKQTATPYTCVYTGNNNATADITIAGPTLITSGAVLNMGEHQLSNSTAANLIIEDGGQLICSNPVAVTVKKNITNASAKAGEKWYAISTPVHDHESTTELVASVTNLQSGTYDMFAYDEASNTWLNQKAGSGAAGFTTMMRGRGYIYRNAADKELAFTGETNVGTVEYGDEYNYLGWSCKEDRLKGFNLVGNPYPHKIYKGVAFATTSGTATDTLVTGYYALEGDGSWTAKTNSDAIDVNQAILVEATEYAHGKNLQFKDRTTAPNAKSNNDNIMFTVENSAYSDIAYAWFDNGNGLKKIEHRNANIPMLYINQDGTDYAIAMMSDNTKSFGLNFKAKTMGTYTLSYKAEGNFDYLHVIDRLTGEDVDMLMDGKYSFVGSPQDNAGRFIVKLGYDNGSSTGSETFVYQNGNDIIVDGEGTLEVFDVTGRKVMTTDINGVETINGLNTGVYIFRVIGETLRTQKIVVR